MKRVVSFVVVVTLLAASPALAAGPDSNPPGPSLARAPVTMKYDFSAKAAGLDRMPTAPARQGATSPAPAQPTEKKSFWKTPWPYVIGGAAVIALVVVSQNTEGGLY